MPTLNEIPTLVGTQVVQTIRKAEDFAVDTVKQWSQTIDRVVPEAKLTDRLPSAREAVTVAFGVAVQAVEAQREAVLRVLDAVEERLQGAEAPAAEPVKAAKSTATKATTEGDAASA